MAHYAFLDNNNIVTEVIVGKDDEGTDWEQVYGNLRNQVCKRTSYNTKGGVYITSRNNPTKGEPFRKNFAGIGFKYDVIRDAFIPPKPYPSWTLDEQSCLWIAPKPCPDSDQPHAWDEYTLSWVKVNM